MVHILFITPYYPPEVTAPAIRIHETAIQLVKLGYQVTVLTTFPNFPSGIVPEEYRGHVTLQERQDGISIIRVWSYITPNKGFLRRILAQLSFGCLAPFLGGRAVGQPDVIIVESPPLFNAIAGRLLACYKKCPFIFTVADLWPASAVQMGMLRNRILIRLAEWLEWTTYQSANLVWGITEGICKEITQRGLRPEKVFLLTNGVDTTKFRPLARTDTRAGLGWDKTFIAIYAGTHGLAHGLHTLLDAAERLAVQTNIRIVLVGDGAVKRDLVAEAQRRQLSNVYFMEPQPHERMPLLLTAADVCLIPLRKLPLFEGALPSKLYEAMACACPVILSIAGEAKRLAEQEARAAIAVEPENADALASAILYLYRHPGRAEALGKRGRAFVEKHFDRSQLAMKLASQITDLLGKKPEGSQPQNLQQLDDRSLVVVAQRTIEKEES